MTRLPGPMAIVALLLAPPLSAEDAEDSWPCHYVNVQVENDLFGSGEDRNYTNGLRASCLSADNDVPAWLKSAVDRVPWFVEGGDLRTGYSIGQNIYTPEDITVSGLLVDDRPYAGWLYAGVGLTADTGQRLDTIELELGVVGPYSLAEDVQKQWHEWIGAGQPQGWDNQLRNEPGVVLFYERKWRETCGLDIPRLLTAAAPDRLCSYNLAGLGADAMPHVGLALGNVFTHAAAGLTLRFGQDLPSDYGPPRIRPTQAGSGFFEPTQDLSWYLFAGIEGRAVARNIFLDGNTVADSHSVDKKPLVGDLQLGLAMTYGRTRVSYTYIFRTKEFDGQDQADQFGSFNLSVRF